jgi:hypothetical protein
VVEHPLAIASDCCLKSPNGTALDVQAPAAHTCRGHLVPGTSMDYRGIRYSLLAGIQPGRWRIVVHAPGVVAPLEHPFQGSKSGADLKARTMIKKWLQANAKIDAAPKAPRIGEDSM